MCLFPDFIAKFMMAGTETGVHPAPCRDLTYFGTLPASYRPPFFPTPINTTLTTALTSTKAKREIPADQSRFMFCILACQKIQHNPLSSVNTVCSQERQSLKIASGGFHFLGCRGWVVIKLGAPLFIYSDEHRFFFLEASVVLSHSVMQYSTASYS